MQTCRAGVAARRALQLALASSARLTTDAERRRAGVAPPVAEVSSLVARRTTRRVRVHAAVSSFERSRAAAAPTAAGASSQLGLDGIDNAAFCRCAHEFVRVLAAALALLLCKLSNLFQGVELAPVKTAIIHS